MLKDLAQAGQPLMIRGAIDALTQGRVAALFIRFALYLIGLAVIKGAFPSEFGAGGDGDSGNSKA